jgi:hypothetical protein
MMLLVVRVLRAVADMLRPDRDFSIFAIDTHLCRCRRKARRLAE